MGDTIEIVFEFLRRHHFTKAEEALKSELTARQNVNGLFLPVSEHLERDLTMQPRPYQETAQTLDIAQDSIQQRRLISGVEPTPFLQKDVEEGVSQSFPRRSSSPPEQDLHAEYTSEHVAFTETWNASTGELTMENTGTSHEQERRFCPQGSRNVSGSPDQTDLRAAKLSSAQVQEYALVSDSQDMLCESSFPITAESLNSVSTQSLPEFLKSYSGIDLNEQATPPASKTMQKEQYAGRHDAQELMPGLHFEGSPIKTVDTLELGKHSSQLEQEEVDISRPQCTSEMGPSSGSQNCNASHELDCTRSKKEDELEKFDKTIIVQVGEVFTKERPQEFGLFLQEPWMKVTTLSFERDNGSSQSVSREADWGKNRFVDSFMCQGSGKDYPLKSPSPVPLADSSLSGDERLVNADESWSKAMEISAVPDLAFERVEDVNETGEGVQGDQGTHEGQLCIDSIRNLGAENFPTNGIPDNVVVELPRLPPVKLHSLDKSFENCKEGSCAGNSTRSFESAAFQSIGSTPKGVFGLGALLDLPLGQGPSSSGKHPIARPSVSQGIVEDISEHLSGFATAGDGQSESAKDYPHEFWDSDIYEGDEDPGYHRQPIEDEAWFLAHEIDYPSEDERARKHVQSNRNLLKEFEKFDDNASLVEAESYFSGEEYCRPKQTELQDHCERVQLTYRSKYSRDDENNLIVSCCHEDTDYDGQLMDAEELSIMRSQIALKGIVSQNSELEVHGEDESVSNHSGAHDTCALELDDGCHGSVGSGGICVRSDAFDFGSEVRESLPGASSEGDTGSLSRSELVVHGPTHSVVGNSSSPQEMFCGGFGRHIEEKGAAVRLLDGYNDGGDDDDDDDEDDMILRYYNEAWGHKKRSVQKQVSNKDAIVPKSTKTCINGGNDKAEQDIGSFGLGGFSFPSPSSTGDLAASVAGSGKSPWSTRDSTAQGEETDDYGNGMIRPDDTLAVWKRKSNESSPVISPRNENLFNTALSNPSAFSAHSTEEYVSMETREDVMEGQYIDQLQETGQADADDEDFANLQEQIRKFGGQDDEYEIFDLRIVHRKNRTGFEEDKDFPVVINSVIAGRYHVTEYLGSAAFSKAIQAHDLYNGMDVCMKVIKNNKDFFDQSLDEIKLLKFINKHDPADKYHILRLYDYFYHREHLFIVCELLRANLYEFHKFNRESGGEVYFTMPRLQSITRQCLEALQFLHGLGLIHCDLKPENILVKSYSRCEIKVIDLGSSCFQTDHLCSYVQSRSYRAPEVILGLPYDEKIDIWSLGCILAELCSGNVLFQNDSIATLLARVVGILGPIDPEMLAQGRDTHKYFTKNHMIYERNQENDQLEYLLPKKTSLSHRLPMGDQGFVEFVGYLLEINPLNRPSATEALNHPWLSYPYEPIIS